MRIFHVVTLVTPDGAFGGPVRVAVNHVRELRRRGHNAIVVAAAMGFDGPLPEHVEDVPAKLFHARRVAPLGFSGLAAPAMLRWVHAQLSTIDVLHVHLARDMITVPVALLAQRHAIPYVVQGHGMVDESSKVLASLLDRAVVRRLLRDAKCVFSLTPNESRSVQTVADGSARVIELRNGVPEFDETPPPKTAEVLFMARLHSRKRPRAFVEMASRILANGVDADFALVGPDEGELSGVMKMIGASGWSHRIRYERALSPTQTRDRLAASSILVLPSVDEPFPMVVLEAMAAGRPVVVTDSCGLAPIIQSTQSGIVVDLTIESLSVAVERLLTNPEDIVLRGQRARATAQSLFSMARVVTEWERAALTCGGTA